jgi:hypothetical protein
MPTNFGNIGYSVSPDQSDQMKKGFNNGQFTPQGGSALQILNMRLPGLLGGSPIAPDGLLRPRVGGGSPTGSVLDQLRQQFGAGRDRFGQPQVRPNPAMGGYDASQDPGRYADDSALQRNLAAQSAGSAGVPIQNFQSPFGGSADAQGAGRYVDPGPSQQDVQQPTPPTSISFGDDPRQHQQPNIGGAPSNTLGNTFSDFFTRFFGDAQGGQGGRDTRQI